MSKTIEKVNIEFTPTEVKQLIKLINIAVKETGVEDGGETANNGVYFMNKLNNAFKTTAMNSTVHHNGNKE
jgi:hypothetical protein